MEQQALNDMLVVGVPIAEKILRPVLVYLFLVIALRLAGKRELAQLNPFDLVVLLTLSNTVQNAIIGNDNSVTGGLIGASTLLLVNYLVAKYLYSHARLERLVEGQPTVIIENGVLLPVRLKNELITLSELQVAAHKQGFNSLDEVERAVIDPGGAIFFTRKQPDAETTRYGEILARLDQINERVTRLAR